MNKRLTIKKILTVLLWLGITVGTVILLGAAIHKKDESVCKGIDIKIEGADNNIFVDKNDILNEVLRNQKENPVGKRISSFNLVIMETSLEKNIWIKEAEFFFDNNNRLQINISEREPVARIFSAYGTTFYIDNELTMLPLSDKFSARLPVFTGFPSDKKVLTKADSVLLGDIRTLSLALQKDSFSMALIEQVDINSNREFEMVPKIGNQVIVFGDAGNITAKLKKIKIFYREVMTKAGWNYYSTINVAFKNQVVAKIKGAEDVAADSLRALQIMQVIAERTQQQAADTLQNMIQDNERNSVDSTMVQQSIQRDENISPTNSNEEPNPSLNPSKTEVKPPSKAVPPVVGKKKGEVKAELEKTKEDAGKVKKLPKAVMKKKENN